MLQVELFILAFRFTDAFWITLHSTENVTDNQSLIQQYIIERTEISTRELSEKVGISQRKIKENIARLKALGFLKRIGSAKGGYWEVIEYYG